MLFEQVKVVLTPVTVLMQPNFDEFFKVVIEASGSLATRKQVKYS